MVAGVSDAADVLGPLVFCLAVPANAQNQRLPVVGRERRFPGNEGGPRPTRPGQAGWRAKVRKTAMPSPWVGSIRAVVSAGWRGGTAGRSACGRANAGEAGWTPNERARQHRNDTCATLSTASISQATSWSTTRFVHVESVTDTFKPARQPAEGATGPLGHSFRPDPPERHHSGSSSPRAATHPRERRSAPARPCAGRAGSRCRGDNVDSSVT